MTESNVQDHLLLMRQTGKHKFTAEQLELMNKIIGDTVIELEEDFESTLELPQLSRK